MVWVGAADHTGWAVLVTVAEDGALTDRRRVELIDPGLPKAPFHHEAQWAQGRYLNVPWARKMSMDEALRIIERVQASVRKCAIAALRGLDEVDGIAIRGWRPIPAGVAERVADIRVSNSADSVMSREALAEAARSRGWMVRWYDAKTVVRAVSPSALAKAVKAAGKPWTVDHKLALAAAYGQLKNSK
jgi:hypothetical protein